MIYKQRHIEKVDHFTYLGVKLVKTGNLRFALKGLNEQAHRAFNTLLFICKNVSLVIKMKLSLFDKLSVTNVIIWFGHLGYI